MQVYHSPTTRLADPVGTSASNSIQYPLLRNSNPSNTEMVVLNSLQAPLGIGEPPIDPIPAAVAHAVFTATKPRLRHPPLKFS
jgi:isoquinoline 1-oxidoreductase beta subunit